MATAGYITPEITAKLSVYPSPSAGRGSADSPKGSGAISEVPAAGRAQIVACGAFCELLQDQSAGAAAVADDFGWQVEDDGEEDEVMVLGVDADGGTWRASATR